MLESIDSIRNADYDKAARITLDIRATPRTNAALRPETCETVTDGQQLSMVK